MSVFNSYDGISFNVQINFKCILLMSHREHTAVCNKKTVKPMTFTMSYLYAKERKDTRAPAAPFRLTQLYELVRIYSHVIRLGILQVMLFFLFLAKAV